MNSPSTSSNVELLQQELDIPEMAYELAERRYKDLGEFFSSTKAKTTKYSPHIYPQGSFRLGTVIRPVGKDNYDLDIGCRLRNGISKASHSQFDLKSLVGEDLDRYRNDRQITEPLEAMHRCWRLKYQDRLPFHMDVVPSIPEDVAQRRVLQERMEGFGIDQTIAAQVAQHAGAITDDRLPNYRFITPDWKVSNSEGFALWFQSRMQLARMLLESQAMLAMTTIDKLPTYRWKSPLQAAVRILKRHRDLMYRKNPDSKPISIIITTLAAEVYRGETDVDSALSAILNRMGAAVRPVVPRVPNPVNPIEDFADKWTDPAYAHLKLEMNFHAWLTQARADMGALRAADTEPLLEKALSAFDVTVPRDRVAKAFGVGGGAHHGPAIIEDPATRPWA